MGEASIYHALMLLGELLQNRLDFLARNENRILTRDAGLLAELIANFAERDIGRVLLVQTKTWTARNGRRDVEVQVTLPALLFDAQEPIHALFTDIPRGNAALTG